VPTVAEVLAVAVVCWSSGAHSPWGASGETWRRREKDAGMGKEEVIVAAMFFLTCCCCCISYQLVVDVLVDMEWEKEASMGMAAVADEDDFSMTCCCCVRHGGGEKGGHGYEHGGRYNGGSSGRRLHW